MMNLSGCFMSAGLTFVPIAFEDRLSNIYVQVLCSLY